MNPKESHFVDVKQIICFVRRIIDNSIWYINETNLSLASYNNADWADNADDRKSTIGGCFHLENNLVLWHSKKHKLLSLFMAEAKYIAARNYCTQLL